MQKTKQTELFKEVMGNYPTGVTVITTTDEQGNPVGLTVNSFASVSLEPLLVLWSIDHKASSFEAFKNTDKFTIHILAGNQKELCYLFSSKDKDRFKSCDWQLSSHGQPIIEDVFAVFHCETFKQIEAGDHTILIGEVTDIDIQEKEPMLYHRRSVGSVPSVFYE